MALSGSPCKPIFPRRRCRASPHDPATAYLAATRYKLDDTRPMLYKTHDYGQTWAKITEGRTGTGDPTGYGEVRDIARFGLT